MESTGNQKITYRGRRAAFLEDDHLRVVVTQEGGHIAELLHKRTGISPLWIPSWRSIEPSEYSRVLHPEYGDSSEAQLVAGLMGHNICLDLFGVPDPSEAAAGITVHGEAPVVPYDITAQENELIMRASLPKAQLTFSRTIKLAAPGVVLFEESVQNHACTDRPVAWTQHVTLGAPFLAKGETRFAVSAGRSKVYEHGFNNDLGMQLPGAEFQWPSCPRKDGGVQDLSTMSSEPASGGFTAHQMNPAAEHSFFTAWSPSYKLALAYVWRTEDFPWLARWEENHLRSWAPWNSQGFALGMEFGVSPMVESRREMVERSRLFGTPTYRWLPARSECHVRYCAILRDAETCPTSVQWNGESEIVLA